MASVRRTAIEYIRARLASISTATGYTRDVGDMRVIEVSAFPTEVPPGSIILVDGDEIVDNRIGERFECSLEVLVGFVDTVRTSNPKAEANVFLAEIQKVMEIEFTIQCPIYPLGSVQPGTIVCKEIGNSLNISSAIPGSYIGQIVYDMKYRRNIHDPNMF